MATHPRKTSKNVLLGKVPSKGKGRVVPLVAICASALTVVTVSVFACVDALVPWPAIFQHLRACMRCIAERVRSGITRTDFTIQHQHRAHGRIADPLDHYLRVVGAEEYAETTSSV
jgi:hypothetical protein